MTLVEKYSAREHQQEKKKVLRKNVAALKKKPLHELIALNFKSSS